MQAVMMRLFAAMLALVGPAPSNTPNELQLKEANTIVAIGDSITQAGGYLRDIDAVLSQQYPDLKTPKVTNAGISGQKAEDLIKRFDKDVVQKKPTFVTISIGINDVWHRLKEPHDEKTLTAYRQNVTKMVEAAQAAGIKVVLLAPTIISEDPAAEGNQRLKVYIAAQKQIAAEKKCQFVDLHAMFLKALEKKPADQKGNWLTSDGVHMNAQGNAIMAIGVLRALGVSDEKIAATETPGERRRR